MNQSAVLGGALLAGFALYLAAQSRLSDYGRVLWGAKPASHTNGASGSTDAAPKSPTAGIIPGTGNFDPLDMFGDYSLGLGDALKHIPSFSGSN